MMTVAVQRQHKTQTRKQETNTNQIENEIKVK